MDVEIGGNKDGRGHRAPVNHGRPRCIRRRRRSTKYPGRIVRHRHRVVRLAGPFTEVDRVLHQQSSGGHRLSLFVPGDRSVVRDRARHGIPRAQARSRSRRGSRTKNFVKREQMPYNVTARIRPTIAAITITTPSARRSQMIGYDEFAQGAGREARQAASSWASGSRPSPRPSAPVQAEHFDIIGIKMFDSCRDSDSSRPARGIARGDAKPGTRPRNDLGADRRRRAREPRSERNARRRGRYRHRAIRPRHVRKPEHARVPAGAIAPGGAPQDAREGPEDRRASLEVGRRRPWSGKKL